MSCTHLDRRQTPDWTRAAVPPVGGVLEEGASGASRLQGLQRENGRLQEQLRSSEELNATLRSELDLHRSIMAQTSSHQEEQDPSQDASGPQANRLKQVGDTGTQKAAAEHSRLMNAGKYVANVNMSESTRSNILMQHQHVLSDLLGEHLQEIRALRQHLEESIRTNDRLREQLEKRLAEVEKDPGKHVKM